MIEKFVMKVYYFMQRHYFTFRIWVWLKEHGIAKYLKLLLPRLMNSSKYQREHPTRQMQKSKEFFSENKERVDKVIELLADDKSRAVMKAVIEYRTVRIPIPENLYSENDQYFVKEIIVLNNDEVFIDGGAYVGDTVQHFINEVKRQEKGKIKRVVAFEPNKNNFDTLKKFYGKRDNFTLFNKGLSDKEARLYFFNSGSASRIVQNELEATDYIDVINIDAVPECHDATFIKMDIEGAEMDALKGAVNTIKRNRPKLVICIYHSDDDILRIAEYINEVFPWYKLYVRHHSGESSNKTVLYAI